MARTTATEMAPLAVMQILGTLWAARLAVAQLAAPLEHVWKQLASSLAQIRKHLRLVAAKLLAAPLAEKNKQSEVAGRRAQVAPPEETQEQWRKCRANFSKTQGLARPIGSLYLAPSWLVFLAPSCIWWAMAVSSSPV